MPKASCQIDEQGGRTGRSTFLTTVAARDAAFVAGDVAGGAPRTTLVVPIVTKPSPPLCHAGSIDPCNLRLSSCFTATKGRRDPWATTTTSH
jgi:hypothetical protein